MAKIETISAFVQPGDTAELDEAIKELLEKYGCAFRLQIDVYKYPE